MSTTYKPALLKAIVRLQRQGPTLELALSAIANSFVALYWTQTVVFHLRQAATLAKEPEVLQKIRRAAAAANTRRLSDLSIANRESLAKSIVATLRIDVLRRFHSALPASAFPLYVWNGSDRLAFTSASAEFIYQNALVLDTIANHWWARKLEKDNMLAPAIIEKIEANGVQRRSLRWFHDRAATTDDRECFYCQADLHDSARPREVDHLIPWSFILADPSWDLVIACPRCNRDKSDRLPHRRFVAKLDSLNERRLQRNSGFLRGMAPIPAGGIAQLYEAARGVEWPNAWEPLLINPTGNLGRA